jgi:methionyl-tRNA formyltransferase
VPGAAASDPGVRWADPDDAAARLPTAQRRLALLAADTPRARAYLDALVAAGRAPDRAILVELGTPQHDPRPTPLFDATTPLPAALRRARVPAVRVPASAFEDPAVLRAIADGAGEELVVAAPPPGVLLAPAFFAIPGRRYLHVHPGRLPAFRGSTPMYHELLAEGRLTASALLLDEGIDTGLLLATRGFAPPADRSTIDDAFDPWMRATLMRSVVEAWAAGSPLAGRPQADGGRTYFVIHPVLRHLAILGSPGRAAIAGQGAPDPDRGLASVRRWPGC